MTAKLNKYYVCTKLQVCFLTNQGVEVLLFVIFYFYKVTIIKYIELHFK